MKATENISKVCTACQIEKELEAFSAVSHHKDGRASQCRECRNTKMRENFKDPEVKKLYKNRNLKYKFGISLEEYNSMFETQKGQCKTCKRHQTELSKTLVVDHSHKTGIIRGLLCDYCNRLLGNYEKKPELFIAFDEYLNESSEEV